MAGEKNDEVITQSLTFVATANSIKYNSANPIFVDVDLDTMGLFLLQQHFLEEFGEIRDDGCYNKFSEEKFACLPMHTFGFPVHLDELVKVCKNGTPLVEDAAESLGSNIKTRPLEILD